METMVVPYAISTYTVIAHEAEEGGYWGEVLELPGCVSQGETMDEFRRNIREALEAILESESKATRIEFRIPESCGEKYSWPNVTETWTATQ